MNTDGMKITTLPNLTSKDINNISDYSGVNIHLRDLYGVMTSVGGLGDDHRENHFGDNSNYVMNRIENEMLGKLKNV